MTTSTSSLNVTGQAVLDIFATGFWAGGKGINHGINVYQGARRLYRNEIASGALRSDLFASANACQDIIDETLEAGDRFLNAWQSASDDFRELVWIVLGPLLVLFWGAALDIAMLSARTLGRVWGYWMAQSRYDIPVVLLVGLSWPAVFADVRGYVAAAVRRLPGMCDRAFQMAFALT